MRNPEKQFVALKYWLLGRNYAQALKALNFGRQYHKGTRKDGVTPEFVHQIEIALFLSTLKDVQDEQTTITAALLHDVMEDYDVPGGEIVTRFGVRVAEIVWKLTKKFQGVKKDLPTYFKEIAADPIASLVKGGDRINNVQTMVGIFSVAKQREYVREVEEHFLPMLKTAKYNFPEQSAAYFNITQMLKSQTELLKAQHDGTAEMENTLLKQRARADELEAACRCVKEHVTHVVDKRADTDAFVIGSGCLDKISRALDKEPK